MKNLSYELSHDNNLRFHCDPLTDHSTGLWVRPCENMFENKSALQNQVSTKLILLIYLILLICYNFIEFINYLKFMLAKVIV